MKRKNGMLWLSLMVIFAVALQHVPIVFSKDSPLVRVDPILSYAEPGENFTIDMMVDDVVELYAWQIRLIFNSSVLEFVDWVEGDFLVDQPEGTWNQSRIEEDYVMISVYTYGSYLGVSGSGWLMSGEFKAKGTGECVLNITHSLTKLIKYNPPPPPPGKPIMELIPHTRENGIFTNVVTPPHVEFTVSPELPGINEEVKFNASGSYARASASEIIQYEWDFADGAIAIYVKPVNLTTTTTHNYTAAGTYRVFLTVVDNASASALMEETFGSTVMPRFWYDLYASTYIDLLIRFTHDIAIIDVTAPAAATIGQIVDVNVQVWNKGTEPESFNLIAYYGIEEYDYEIEKKPVTLGAGATETFIFHWDTSEVAEGTYRISANATDVVGEEFLEDNYRIDGTIELQLPSQWIPLEYVAVIVAVVVVAGVAVFLYMRRRG